MTAEKCGAITVGGERCNRPAGLLTENPGEGRCFAHKTWDAEHGDAFRRTLEEQLGMGAVTSVAETLSSDEVDYVRHVSDASLEIIRGRIVASMFDANRSPKELADLTMALSRVDTAIAKLNKARPDAIDREATAQREGETERLAALQERIAQIQAEWTDEDAEVSK